MGLSRNERGRKRTGGPESWTVPPPWKLYFNPWSPLIVQSTIGKKLDKVNGCLSQAGYIFSRQRSALSLHTVQHFACLREWMKSTDSISLQVLFTDEWKPTIFTFIYNACFFCSKLMNLKKLSFLVMLTIKFLKIDSRPSIWFCVVCQIWHLVLWSHAYQAVEYVSVWP